jgi:hypothetical protein
LSPPHSKTVVSSRFSRPVARYCFVGWGLFHLPGSLPSSSIRNFNAHALCHQQQLGGVIKDMPPGDPRAKARVCRLYRLLTAFSFLAFFSVASPPASIALRSARNTLCYLALLNGVKTGRSSPVHLRPEATRARPPALTSTGCPYLPNAQRRCIIDRLISFSGLPQLD